jgi:uncharacterized membrane protein YkvA (DUF1232 family)
VSATTVAIALAVAFFSVYVSFVLVLLVFGRRDDARAVVRFVPDCVVLFRRLLADPRVRRRDKVLLAALVPYLLLPFDLVPDFIPVAGQLDDAVLVALVLRRASEVRAAKSSSSCGPVRARPSRSCCGWPARDVRRQSIAVF